MVISEAVRHQLLSFQRNEITEHHIYAGLARVAKGPGNQEVLDKLSQDELRHYHQWKAHTGQEIEPDRVKVWQYCWISRILGFTFAAKLMERGEEGAQDVYAELADAIPEAETIAEEEHEHEDALLQLLDEESLRYMGSIVLGLSDALVELTGALAGFTLALQDTKLIALTGSITGIAAALSMGASEYLSTKSEETVKNPVTASVYTGGAYVVTVLILVLPYLLLENYYVCLGCALSAAVLIIAFFSYYNSVARDEPFKRRFAEMVAISLGVAGFSFVIGLVMRSFLGIDA
jgi:VIT1/CCC1 family predicted Fe2+/Mn2+ transporter